MIDKPTNNKDAMNSKANMLGDVRAEADHEMLDIAFFETPDYRTLIESSERVVVVGRRGTGKSAITYRLYKYWDKAQKSITIGVSPEEDEVIGLRAALRAFGESFRHIRAGARIAWRYALLMEIASRLSNHYKFSKSNYSKICLLHLKTWSPNRSVIGNLREALKRVTDSNATIEERIGDMSSKLDLKALESDIRELLEELSLTCVYLIDKLDEGYEPDCLGTALVDGLVQAVIDINTSIDQVRPTVFLRDNIFRSVQKLDPDFSRNIESQVLRLHWDEVQLFTMITNRIRIAAKLEAEKSLKVWNEVTAYDLEGKDGFRKCLQLTLYRPRDLLILLNNAFYAASKEQRTKIVGSDIEASAKEISTIRLDDLHKEYSTIIPGLEELTLAFSSRNPEVTMDDAASIINDVISADNYEASIQQTFRTFDGPIDVLKALYSIGFIGLRDEASSSYVFCHDGRNPNTAFDESKLLLIHPCYWMALNATKNTLNPEEAQEIYDEYDIEVTSEEPERRKTKIGQMITELSNIQEGTEGASQFESWCLGAVSTVFAGALRNIELHPNRDATQRRDIVATNLSDSDVWKRIYEDYRTRQVIFEVKNFKNLGPAEYRQMNSYLTGEYGKLGFVITRDDDINPTSRDLDWIRELYSADKKLVIKLTGKFLASLLSKLRSPQKHSAPDKAIHGILDSYIRLYVSGKGASKRQK